MSALLLCIEIASTLNVIKFDNKHMKTFIFIDGFIKIGSR